MLGSLLVEGLLLAKQRSLFSLRSATPKIVFADTLSGFSVYIRGSNAARSSGSRHYASVFRTGGAGNDGTCARLGFLSRAGNPPGVEIFRGVQTKPYEVETNLPKDVLLYRFENRKYHKLLNLFAISQLFFWTYLAEFVYTELKDIPLEKMLGDDLPWWRRFNFGESVHRTAFAILTFLVGYGIFCLCWTHTLKSVRYLVLRKGGNDITFVTNTPFGGNRLRTVPLEKVTCKQSRTATNGQLPMKVKGDMMHYLLDMRGEFRHPELFDFTAGLKRSVK